MSDAAVNATIEELKFDVKPIKQEGGEVEYEVTLPLTLPSLRRLPGIRAAQNVARVVGLLRYLRGRVSGDTALKLMSRYRSALARFTKGVRDEEEEDPARVKPAGPALVGTAYALLAGNRHIVTFDKVPYEFDGGCRYILSRYKHNAHEDDESALDFTVLVDYAMDGGQVAGRSVSIVVGSKTVTLQANLVVQLDHADVALPLVLENENVHVERRGSHVEAALLNGAFVVKCYAPHQVCEFIASRHLHGKLVGLLGNMNGDTADDALTPDGEEASDAQEYANAWHVETGCTLEAKPPVDDTDVDLPANSTGLAVCKEAFDNAHSALAPCFGTVDEDRYESICERDVERAGTKQQPQAERNVACRVAAMYLHECQLQLLPGVALPASCSRCALTHESAAFEIPVGRDLLARSSGFDLASVDTGPAGSLLATQPEIIAASADVVFVVEEDAGCIASFSSLDTVVDALETALTNSTHTNNRYALVGASRSGKKGQHVHVGKEGSEFVSAAEVKQLLAGIHVPANVPRDRSQARWLAAPTQKGLFGALRNALSLFSRASTVRQVVLVRCSSCSWSAQEVDDVRDLLRRAGAKLHLITPFANVTAATPFGFDLSLRAPEGPWGARSSITMPSITGEAKTRDACLTLASNDRSLVVDLRRINANAFASAVVRRAADAGACRRCQCLADTEDGGSGLVTRCNACAERSAFFVRTLFLQCFTVPVNTRIYTRICCI